MLIEQLYSGINETQPQISEHCFVILIPLYCKFTVLSWLNDCEDMKLVIPIQETLERTYS